MRRSSIITAPITALLVTLVPTASATAGTGAVAFPSPGKMTRVSVTETGAQANGMSLYASMSGDGRYIAFVSDAANIVSGDKNQAADVFLRDHRTGTVSRISVASDGTEARYRMYEDPSNPTISDDGRYVAYLAAATNLVPGDESAYYVQAYLYDTVTKTTSRISQTADGTPANGDIEAVTMTGDGRFIAYQTYATNLVSGNSDYLDDILIYDRLAGTTERILPGPGGTPANSAVEGPTLSADGRYVAFTSMASNLVNDDTNGGQDVFLYDRQDRTTLRVSVSSDGAQGDWRSFSPSISADGRYVVYDSWSSNLVPGDTNESEDVMLYDRVSRTTTLVSAVGGTVANGSSGAGTISADGKYVTFMSSATDLSPLDSDVTFDIYRRNLATATTDLLSVSADGVKANGPAWFEDISTSGRSVLFSSDADNLVPDDTNSEPDVFLTTR